VEVNLKAGIVNQTSSRMGLQVLLRVLKTNSNYSNAQPTDFLYSIAGTANFMGSEYEVHFIYSKK
jgi:hypothetical protein